MSDSIIYAAIDPGLTGAVAVMQADGEKPTLRYFQKMPVSLDDRGKKLVDGTMLEAILKGLGVQAVVMEYVHAMPHDGRVSLFSFGVGVGVVRGVCSVMGLPVSTIDPMTWKRACGIVGKGKNASVHLVKEWYPHLDLKRTGPGKDGVDHNIADAICLGVAGRWLVQQPLSGGAGQSPA